MQDHVIGDYVYIMVCRGETDTAKGMRLYVLRCYCTRQQQHHSVMCVILTAAAGAGLEAVGPRHINKGECPDRTSRSVHALSVQEMACAQSGNKVALHTVVRELHTGVCTCCCVMLAVIS
jgi:hypothetical protein